MTIKSYTGVVGSKNELFPPKEVREALGIKGGKKVLYIIKGKELVVRVIPSFEEALNQPKFIATTVKEFEKEMKEWQKKIQERTT
jgi:bifunctional DNA-binding transcriptional regulator/antitoxin component of YhaV-PrlF toxin-antitoxin module